MQPPSPPPRRSGIVWVVVCGVLAAVVLAAVVGKFILELLVLD